MPSPTPQTPMSCRHLSVSIPKPYDEVYDWLSDPANWPSWASGLGEMQHDATRDVWISKQESGVVTIVFTPKNAFGILDHRVTLPDGSEVYSPMRAIPNGDGTEVVFTLFRLPTMDDATWARDEEWVRKDMAKLCWTI